jgi:hypothetical protein
VKPAGINAPEKPDIHGKSNPANTIKKTSVKEPSGQRPAAKGPTVGTAKSHKSASELKTASPVRPALTSAVKSPQSASPAGKTIPAKAIFNKMAANMGFPKDTLSVALLVFARYFSVSLSPALMKTLRREILASGKASSPETKAEKTALEADALSSLIALDKGVELSAEALEHYARFFSFPDGNYNRQDEADDDPKGDHDREESEKAEELRILAEEQGQNDGVLTFLNQLPGKNGQYWLVYPFDVKVKGIEFQVFFRLLRKEPGSSGEDSHSHLIVDISGPKKQWRCILNKAGEKYLADLRVYPGQSAKAIKALQKKAEHVLKEGRALFGSFKGFDEILVQNRDEAPSWADDLCPESLPSIDEKV